MVVKTKGAANHLLRVASVEIWRCRSGLDICSVNMRDKSKCDAQITQIREEYV